jgi:hypothetical protein
MRSVLLPSSLCHIHPDTKLFTTSNTVIYCFGICLTFVSISIALHFANGLNHMGELDVIKQCTFF